MRLFTILFALLCVKIGTAQNVGNKTATQKKSFSC